MGTPDYKGGWQRRLWQFMDAASVNITSNDISFSVVDDITRKVRQGEVFHFNRVFEGVGDGNTADILLSTGSNRPSVRIAVASGAKSIFTVHEDVTTSDDGTEVTKYSRNRNTSPTFDTTVFHTPTITNSGTVIAEDYLPGGIKNKEVGASNRDLAVWIIKPNTKYLLRVNNTSGGSEDILISGDCFEDVS